MPAFNHSDWRPPADAWTRRDVMRNGMASFAGLCLLGNVPGTRRPGSKAVTSAALRAQARSPFEPFRRDLPIHPSCVPTRRTRNEDVLRGHDPRGDGRDPARLRDADLRLRRASTPARRSGRAPAATTVVTSATRCRSSRTSTCTAASVHRGDDGHPMDLIVPGGSVRLPLPQRPGRRDAVVPRPRARANVADALLRPAGDVRARGRPRARARPAARRSTTCRS